MGLFTTRQLLGYTEQKVKFNPLFLSLFFRRTVTFPTQEVMLDKITGKTPIAAYVSPVVGGKVLRNRGGETRVLRPGYVKPKHEVNYAQVVERLPGEDPARLNDPAYRRLRILTDNLKQEEKAIVQVEEMQAVSAVLNGKYTMQGEQFDTVEVDFGRSAGNNIIQATGKKWSEQDRETFDPTYDLDMYCDQASGLINIAVMDGKVWRLLNGFKLFREKLDTRRGSNSQLETAVKDLGAVVSFKGYYGDLAIVVAKTSYVADNGTEKRYLPEGTLVLGNTAAEGIRCYGAIQDSQALAEGIVVATRYPKHWLTVGDPANEYTMTQSAPLMVCRTRMSLSLSLSVKHPKRPDSGLYCYKLREDLLWQQKKRIYSVCGSLRRGLVVIRMCPGAPLNSASVSWNGKRKRRRSICLLWKMTVMNP